MIEVHIHELWRKMIEAESENECREFVRRQLSWVRDGDGLGGPAILNCGV